MKLSKWQHFKSQLWPVLLFQGKDHRQKHIELHVVRGRLRLQVAEAIYSYDDLYHVFKKAFNRVNLSKVGNKALILGYGLGSIPFILEKEMGLRFQLTGVELDPIIVSLAKKYANPRLRSEIQLIPIDAQSYLTTNKKKFDLICVDLFIGENVPSFAKSDVFFKQLATTLTQENSLLLFNYLRQTPDDFESTYKLFLATFPNGSYLNLGSNYMMISERNKGLKGYWVSDPSSI